MTDFFKREEPFDRILTAVERVFMGICIAATMVIMVAVSMDAIFRYGFNMPITGVYEITEDYLMVALIFLSLSHAYRSGWFIRVTVISDLLPAGLRNVYERLCRLLALTVCALIVIGSAEVAFKAFEVGEFSSNLLHYPLAPAYMLVPVGTCLLCLRLLQFSFSPREDH